MTSLLSLCLLKVSSERLNYEDLPPALVKDLNLMKAFNRNFKYEHYWGDDEYHNTILTILCIDSGDYYKLELDKFRILEGKKWYATPPFRYTVYQKLARPSEGTFYNDYGDDNDCQCGSRRDLWDKIPWNVWRLHTQKPNTRDSTS